MTDATAEARSGRKGSWSQGRGHGEGNTRMGGSGRTWSDPVTAGEKAAARAHWISDKGVEGRKSLDGAWAVENRRGQEISGRKEANFRERTKGGAACKVLRCMLEGRGLESGASPQGCMTGPRLRAD